MKRLVGIVLVSVACQPSPPAASPPPPPPPGPTRTAAPEASSPQPAAPPDPCPLPQLVAEDWRHAVSTRFAVKQGRPQHALIDPVVNPGKVARVAAKFAYGKLSKDLEDERVRAFVRPILGDGSCAPWQQVGEGMTNDDGRVTIEIASAALASSERYAVQLVVAGDLTRARGEIFVVAAGRRSVVFDVDGTLTTGDDQIVEQLLSGAQPDMRAGADEVARDHHDAGYLVIYVTGRPMQLAELTRAWLAAHRFPPGPLLTAPTLDDAKPSADGVGRFKREVLLALKGDAGLVVARAYGNAPTDICAYAEAGVDPRATFIVGRHGGQQCRDGSPTQPLTSYVEQAASLSL